MTYDQNITMDHIEPSDIFEDSMSEIPEDGDSHAFPTSSIDGFTQHGMTLRDYFAAAALTGLLANEQMTAIYTVEEMGAVAFNAASAMLKARG